MLGLPDAMLVRPRTQLIFDAVKDEIWIVTRVQPEAGVSAEKAHARAVDVGRRLADDEAHLLLKVRKASLPGSIADGAGALGLEVARGENTVNLVVDEHHRVTFAPDTAAAQAVAADGKAGASEGSRGGRP